MKATKTQINKANKGLNSRGLNMTKLKWSFTRWNRKYFRYG